jgi:putative NADH-flavin reductase
VPITARDQTSKFSHSGTPRTFFFMVQTRKLVTVYGATGNQGRSVVKSLLRAPDSFEVRAITRNPNSVAAQELSTLGASLVQADGSQSNQMTEAFHGSWAVFLNINSDDPVSGFR